MSHSTRQLQFPMVFLCNKCMRPLNLFQDVTVVDGQQQHPYMAECFHIFCHGCRANCQNQCAACHKQTRFLAITRDMPERYKIYFTDIRKLQADHLMNTADFQRQQDELIVSRTIKKQKYLDRKCAEALQNAKSAEEYYQKELGIIRKLGIICQKVRDEKRRRDEIKQRENQFDFKPNPVQCGRDKTPERRGSGAEKRRLSKEQQFDFEATPIPEQRRRQRSIDVRREQQYRVPEYDSSTKYEDEDAVYNPFGNRNSTNTLDFDSNFASRSFE